MQKLCRYIKRKSSNGVPVPVPGGPSEGQSGGFAERIALFQRAPFYGRPFPLRHCNLPFVSHLL
jgi:hypothetical protein